MLKKRLIFTLLYNQGEFMLSRNFRLQKVGNLKWLKKNYDFTAITNSIDELVVLNVDRRDNKDVYAFHNDLSELVKECFMPVAAGGGIRSVDDAYKIIAAGADKLVVNTPLYSNQELVKELVGIFGSQCIVASIDFRLSGSETLVYSSNGSVQENLTLTEAVMQAEELGCGELYLTSMNNDGTGQGLDLINIKSAALSTKLPVIASGGVGNFDQILGALQTREIDAVSTANLFNFMADGLTEARKFVSDKGLQLASWSQV